MVPLEDARSFVLQACPPLPPCEVALADVGGLVLAADVVAGEDVPPFPNTAVDGYAVRACDTAVPPVMLAVVGEIAAGAAPNVSVGPGQAVRIMTGAPMPEGADAVVMVEDTDLRGDRSVVDGSVMVEVRSSVEAGDAVRGVGSDVHLGDVVFTPGTVVSPAVRGVLASINSQTVLAHPRVRVAVLSTGDELVDDGSALAPGQIRESNKVMLLGMVRDAGCEPVDLGIVRDDEAELERVLRLAAASCDAIVTSGGVSMGDYDVVKAVLSRIADMRWMQIAIKPAKPFAFGRLDASGRQIPVFGLPGNPVSSLVSFELLARPALRQMAGVRGTLTRPIVLAVADEPLRRRPDGKLHVMRVTTAFGPDGRVHVRSAGAQGSHQLAASAVADGLAEVPDGDGVPAGGDVRVWLLGSPA